MNPKKRRIARSRIGSLLSTTALASAAILSVGANSSRAQTGWSGTVSNNWFIPGNWSAGVPAAATTTTINTVTPNPTVIDGAAAVSGPLNVGTGSGTTGNLTIQNAGTLATTGNALVGAGGHGAPSSQPFSTGAVLATGAGSAWMVSGALRLGGEVTLGGVPPGYGAGQLTIENGAIVTSGNATIFSNYFQGIGHQPTDPESKALVTGAGSTWNAGTLTVSGDPDGPFDHLTIAAGGVVNSTTSAITGSARVTGPGSAWNTGTLGIGQVTGFGHGQLFIENGATVNTTGNALITAQATVSGAGSAWNISGNLSLGTLFSAGVGLLEISKGATVNVANGAGTVTLGAAANPGYLSSVSIGAGPATAPGTLNAANVVLDGAISWIGFGHNATNYVFAPLISGNGALSGAAVIHNAGTTIFTANNTYTGGTTINGGTLQLGNGGASGAVAGDIAIGAGAALGINRTGTLTLNGAISGAGALTQTGSVTTTLGGNGVAFTGTSTINGGTMLVNGNFGSSAFTVNTGGTLGGTGTVGATTINAGGTIAPGTSIGVDELTVQGLLTFQQNANYIAEVTPAAADRITVTGSGANLDGRLIATDLGGVYVPGQYTLLSATNGFFNTRFASLATIPGAFSGLAPSLIYSGNNLLLNLAVATAQATWLQSPGSDDYWTGSNWTGGSVPNGTAFFNATDTPNIEFENQAGSPSVIIGSFVFGANAPAYTFAMQSDTVTFNGAGIVNNSSFAPTFDVGNRSRLEFINTSTAGNAVINLFGSAGRVQFRDNSTAANATITVGNAFSFGLLDFFENSTAANATINILFGTTSFRDNSTAGDATIVNQSALLFGNSASAGTAKITNNSGGGIRIHSNATADTATIINKAGATVDVSNTNVPGGSLSVGIGSLSGAGNVFLGERNLTLGNLNLDDTISGVIADGGDLGGTGGSLTKIGTGTLTLSGANTYTGATTINAGTLQASAANTFAPSSAFNVAAGAALDLNSFNQTVGSLAGSGNVALGSATLTAGGNNAGTTFSGAISGAGGFTKSGTGTMILSGNNTFAGDTLIDAGTLQLGNGGTAGALAGNVINNANLAFNRSDAVTFAGAISGTGAVQHNGPGTTILTAANTYTGATTVNAGILEIAQSGSIVSATTVNGGTFVMNGASRSVTVNNGGTLGGTGTLGSTTINSGGTLSPGNSIGVFNVNGNLVLGAGAIYLVEVSPTSADRTNVTGTAQLAGELRLLFGPGSYNSNTYTILSANGGRTGTFDTVTTSGLPATLSASVSYTGTEVLLMTLTSQIAPTMNALTGNTRNQRAVAAAQDTAFNAGLPNITALYGLSLAQLPGALDQLSGEMHASSAGVLLDESLYPRSAVLGRLRQASHRGNTQMASLTIGGPQAFTADGSDAIESALAFGKSPIVTKAPRMAAPAGYDVTFWAQGFGAWGRFDGDGNATNVRRNLAGFFSGVDTRVSASGRIGVMAGYTGSNYTLNGRGGANVETGHLAGYGGWSFGALNLRGGVAGAFHTIDTSRTVNFPGLFDSLTAHYEGRSAQVFGEGGYGFALGNVAIEPFAGAAWVNVKTDAMTERGGAAALAAAANSFEVGYSTLGVRAASMVPLANDMLLVPRVSLAWQHAFNDVTPDARLAFAAASVPFVIAGVPIASDSALAEAGLDFAIGRGATVGISYTGQIASNVQDHAAKGKFTWKF